MKKILLIFALLTTSFYFVAHANLTKVKLKNGVEVTGTLISFDPAEKVIIEIGGKESTIKMIDIESIEKVDENNSSTSRKSAGVVESENTLPKEKIINIAGHDVKFILVPKYIFSYGYDGNGSLTVDSEPVHEVEVSSFYVSAEPVTVILAKDIIGNNPWKEYEYYYDKKIFEEK